MTASRIPLVSVVIPMRNERDWIEPCLASVLAQDYPRDRMEVIVVDGRSDDGSAELLQRLAAEDGRVRVLANPARIVPSSLNLAITSARGEIVARVDAHTVLEPDYLSRGVELLARTGADNVGGPMVCIGGGAAGDAIANAMGSRVGIGAYFHFASDERECDTVYMGMWPRRVFERVGLFDEQLVRNQDDEHSYRIRKAGGRVVVSPAMRSRYQNRRSWRALAKQFFEYGLWKVRVLQKHPAQMSLRHFAPPMLVAGLAAAAPLAAVAPPLAALIISVYGLYLLAMLSAAWSWGGSIGARLRGALALLIMHHAWGAGFCLGLVRFAHRWLAEEEEDRKLEGSKSAA